MNTAKHTVADYPTAVAQRQPVCQCCVEKLDAIRIVMRNLPLNRMQAEWLVDLLEKCDQKETGTWRHELASEIRELFGMSAYPEWQTSRVVKLPAWFWDDETFRAVLMIKHEPTNWTHWMPFTGQLPSAPPGAEKDEGRR